MCCLCKGLSTSPRYAARRARDAGKVRPDTPQKVRVSEKKSLNERVTDMRIPFALRTQSEAPLYRMEIVKIDYYYVKRLFLLAGSRILS